jgi:TolB-like protein/Tfp pilus assembly protein PilF
LVIDGNHAVLVIERLLMLDPLREDWQRTALTLYARYRGRSEALAQADVFAATLQRELGVGLDKETCDLLERIRRSDIATAASPPMRHDPVGSSDEPKASVGLPDSSTDFPAQIFAPPGRTAPPLRRRVPHAIAAGLAVVVLASAWGLASGKFVHGHGGKETTIAGPALPAADRWQAPKLSSAPNAGRNLRNVIAVAVLPFVVLGENAQSMQPVADTLTDDLTNTLSRSPGLRVISRQSMQGYRGRPVDIAAVGTELDVRYVLEGSIRTEGDRLRVNVELIDPATRSPAWSARVERQNGEQSSVRDEIVGRLARELPLEMPVIEVARAPADPGVRDLNYKGWAAIYASGSSIGALRQAEEAFSQALARDPNSIAARIGLGTFHALAGVTLLGSDAAPHFAKAEEFLLPVIQASPNGTGAYFSMGLVHQGRGDFARAINAFQRALEFNPSHAPAYAGLGYVLIQSGKAREGLDYIQYATRLSPRDAQRSHWLRFSAEAELELGHPQQALLDLRQSDALSPHQPQTLRTLAVVLAVSGELDQARRTIAQLHDLTPALTADRVLKRAVKLGSGQPEYLRGLRLALAASGDPWQSPRPAHSAGSDAKPVLPILILPFTTFEEAGTIRLIADMITDDLTNTLSRVPSFRVISRQTARRFQGQAVDVAKLGAELQVRYVLEGSIRMQGERLRVNVELIDPATRLPVWTGRIERDDGDRQGVQDEIVGRLARELQFEVLPIESARLARDFDADALAYRGWAALSGIDHEDYKRALSQFEQALVRDRENLSALTGVGAYHARMGAQLFDTDSNGHRAKAEQILRAVVQRDPQSSEAHFYLALALNRLPTLPEAMEHLARAIEIQPSNASAHAQIGNALIRSGRPTEGLEHVLYAMRLSPRDPVMPVWLEFAGNAELERTNYPEAIANFSRAVALNPGYPRSWAGLVAAHALAGHDSEARGYTQKLKTLSPNLSADALVLQYGRHDGSRLREGLRLAFALDVAGAGQ